MSYYQVQAQKYKKEENKHCVQQQQQGKSLKILIFQIGAGAEHLWGGNDAFLV